MLALYTSNRNGWKWVTEAGTAITVTPEGGTLPDWRDRATLVARGGGSGSNEEYIAGHNESYFWGEYRIDRLSPGDVEYVRRCIDAQEGRKRLTEITTVGQQWSDYCHGGLTAELSGYIPKNEVWCAGLCGSPDHYERAAREIVQYASERGIQNIKDAMSGPFRPDYWTRPPVASGGFLWEPHEQATLAFVAGWHAVKAGVQKDSPEHMAIVADVSSRLARALGREMRATIWKKSDWSNNKMACLRAMPDGAVMAECRVGGSPYETYMSDPVQSESVGTDGGAIVAFIQSKV